MNIGVATIGKLKKLTFDELIKIRWNKIFESLGITFDGVVFEKYFR